jgi:WD40 repeat protein
MRHRSQKTAFAFRLALGLVASSILARSAEDKPSGSKPAALTIAEMKRTAPVDFEKEILPIFKSNCLACHNQTKAKAELVLETPQTILKGGESGPAVLPGKGAESLLLKAAAHQSDPMMPPRDNKVAASNLTPAELGLLKLWIDQGAKGEVHAAVAIEWKQLPDDLNPIYAVALTRDGQFAACGRANQIFIYHIRSGQLVTRLTDPELCKNSIYQNRSVAHRDMVHSLAFNPDSTLLASGDYRQAKLWRRPNNVQKLAFSDAATNAWKAAAVSPDGKWLATGSEDGNVKLFDLATGKEAKLLAGAEKAITSLQFSPDATKLASGSADKKLRIWTVQDGGLFAQIEVPSDINAVTWAVAGQQIVSGGTDKIIRLWKLPDAAKGELTPAKELKGHEGAITSLDTLLPAGNEIVSGGSEGSLRHWNIEKGQLVREMKHGGPIASVAVRSDGKRFASAGLNNIAKLWDAKDGKQIAELKGDRYAQELAQAAERTATFAGSEVSYRKTSLQTAEKQNKDQADRVVKATEAAKTAGTAFAEKQKQFETAKSDKTAAEKALVDLQAEIKKVTEDFQNADKAAKQSAEEAKAAVEKASQARIPADQTAETKRITERIAVDTASVAAKTKAAADIETVAAAKTSAGKLAAEAASVALKAKEVADSVAADATAKSKSASDAKASAEKAIETVAAKYFAAGQLKPLFDKVTAGAAENQKQATNKITAAIKALTDTEKEFKKAELAKSTTENELQLAKKSVEQAAEAVTVAKAALQAAEAEQKKADAELQMAKKAASEAEKPIRAVAFSPDNLTVSTAGDDQFVHTWSAEDGHAFEIYRGHKSAISAVAFTKQGALLSTGANQTAIVWDVNPAWVLERVIGTGDAASPIVDRVNGLGFSPDGKLLATGSGEPTRGGEIKIWQVADGSLAQELKNVHSDAVFSLEFSSDGKYLASGAADKFVKVVELSTAKIVRSFEGHTHHVLGVSWKRDGRTLASSGADNVVKMWDFVTGERKKTIEGFTKEVTSVSFVGATDQAVTCAGDNQVRTIKENGDRVRSFDGVTDFMHSAAVTPDGKIVVAGGQDSVLRVWNGTDGKVLTAFAPSKKQ